MKTEVFKLESRRDGLIRQNHRGRPRDVLATTSGYEVTVGKYQVPILREVISNGTTHFRIYGDTNQQMAAARNKLNRLLRR